MIFLFWPGWPWYLRSCQKVSALIRSPTNGIFMVPCMNSVLVRDVCLPWRSRMLIFLWKNLLNLYSSSGCFSGYTISLVVCRS